MSSYMTKPDTSKFPRMISVVRHRLRNEAKLDERGRCCGRKPILYKRPSPHHYCAFCNATYDPEGRQIENSFWKPEGCQWVKRTTEPEPEPPRRLKVDDILACSWGYDETRVDFYRVTWVSNSGKTVSIVKIEQKIVSRKPPEDLVIPDARCHGQKPMLRHPWSTGGVRIRSYSAAFPWDGNPMRQTSPGYGH